MPEVYDCCMFFNEMDMLETRLHILEDVVDHFVICEANQTHSGQSKPYHIPQHPERLERWWDKIIYVQVDDLTGQGRNSWERERYQRSRIADGLVDAQPNDWIIVTDCDEIPDPLCVSYLKDLPVEADAIKFELDFFYYNFSHRVHEGWAVAAMRQRLGLDPNQIRTCAHEPWDTYFPGGWHLSYFMSPDQVSEKLDAFMHHADVAKDTPRDPYWIAKQMVQGADLFGRNIRIETLDKPFDRLPQYIKDNQAKYQDMGWLG